MSEVIVITSGKGGVGKTTTTANIGTGLAKLGKKVVMIDTDIGLRNLDVVMGLENRIVYNLVDVVEGNCRLKQALIKDKRYSNLFLLPSAQTRDKSAVSPEQMRKLVDELRKDFDYILLDCPAGIEQGFKNAIAGADRAIIVTTPEVSAIRDADRIIGLLEAEELKKIELVINRIRMDMVKRGDMMSVEDVVDILAIDLIGVVPDDESIVIATNEGEPLVGSDTQAGKAFANICHRVLGEEVPIMEFETENGGKASGPASPSASRRRPLAARNPSPWSAVSSALPVREMAVRPAPHPKSALIATAPAPCRLAGRPPWAFSPPMVPAASAAAPAGSFTSPAPIAAAPAQCANARP